MVEFGMYQFSWKFLVTLQVFILVQFHADAGSIRRFDKHTKVIHRSKRGILSKTGLCPAMELNTMIRDNRLNFFGRALVLPGDETVNCYESECAYDHDCEADKKCCRNNCGASVCTEAARPPHPCEFLQCPEEMICKIERVRCRMPHCPDLYARSRPTCVEKPGYRARIPLAEIPQEPGPNEVHFVPQQQTGNQPMPFSTIP